MSLFHIGSEFRRFGHGLLPRLAILVVTCLPLVFGGLFVWAYYDPIGHMNKLPVALVNSDQGAQREGTTLNAGQQVAENMLQSDELDFHLVSAEEAKKGVAQGDYYFAVELPTDFSQAAVSVNSEHPHSAKLNVALYNNNGFIPTMVGNQATLIMLQAIDAELGKQISNQLLVGFNTIGEKMGQAVDGSQQLADGSTSARDGSQQLLDGAGQLTDGSQQLTDGSGTLTEKLGEADAGAHKLADGAGQLDDGLARAKDGSQQLADGLSQLNEGTERLADGAGQVSGGVNQVVDSLNAVAGVQQDLVGRLDNAAAMLREANLPPTNGLAADVEGLAASIREAGLGPEKIDQLLQLQGGAQQIADQLGNPVSEYRSGMNRAASASRELAAGISQLKDGSAQLRVGANTLADGTSQLVEGSRQLTVGATALRDGLVTLDTGAGDLASGLGRLGDGAGELSLRLGQGASQVPTWEGQRLSDAATAAGQPVQRELVDQDVTKFGVGLAPFFMSMALFMGSFAMWMVMRPLQLRAVDSGTSPLRAVLASYLPGVIVGVSQATIVWAVLEFLIGLNSEHPLLMLGCMWGVSAVFVAVSQMINAVVGATAGRVFCMIFMAVQLTSSGGLYPVETQPAFFRWVHPVDPMTYSVNLFRYSILGAEPGDHRAITAVGVLLFVGVLALLISSMAARQQRVLKHKDLHPELQV
ncbi:MULTISPECIES: YhgE/Pip domain-containing protein [unclassified Corynebacterium]|uniref:YhgE/Pip domain-containing protein n=1 Tax=unclassified Corynebacterium TaxID=2624378 RepID=UPI0029C9D16E|nr:MULTISPECIES: YhgE/Pip domain-containing protein [unclassified Corynebacterium]WPF65178.1 YhgE/Pip domain-containing protein [Corynebacterium sp. 22KM0430]WPF67674.1 YhgE/Pip domain-containing protein [Corynebacterium sp. 21KM1197]